METTVRNRKMNLGERLVAAGLITETQLELALREQKRRGGQLARILVELGLVGAERIADFMAREAQVRFVDLNRTTPDRSLSDLIPPETARRHRCIPVSRVNGSLTVAMADPLNVVAIDTLAQITGLHIEVVAASEHDILNHLDLAQRGEDGIRESIDQIIDDEETQTARPTVEEEVKVASASSQDDAPVIRLVSQIISRAVNIGASDIHFEPEEKLMRIRMRIDGVLHPDVLIPKSLQPLVCARMKILAEMDVAESRIPQDGRATVTVGQRPVNLRVSSLPTNYGENVVVRILDSGGQQIQLTSMGLTATMEQQVRALMDKPHGVLIVTGPTGSGKSTTLYAMLREICSTELSIFTLEDPVEYRMAGVRQTQIKEEVGLTFSSGLRALLRQDPDIILVGETRDTETAQLMIRAALTGHLVFSTLHTNDAPGAIPRLLDMGVEPFLLPDSLLGVLAQRLVRKVCERCREPVPNPDRVFSRLNIQPPADLPLQLWRGVGCPVCKGSGYRGRQGIFELMTIDERFHEPIVRRSGAPEFYHLARTSGMTSMFEDGLRRAVSGTTTIEELLRVTRLTPQ